MGASTSPPPCDRMLFSERSRCIWPGATAISEVRERDSFGALGVGRTKWRIIHLDNPVNDLFQFNHLVPTESYENYPEEIVNFDFSEMPKRMAMFIRYLKNKNICDIWSSHFNYEVKNEYSQCWSWLENPSETRRRRYTQWPLEEIYFMVSRSRNMSPDPAHRNIDKLNLRRYQFHLKRCFLLLINFQE